MTPPHLFDLDASTSTHTPCSGSIPKMDFPKFNGDNPRLWMDQCEEYFEIYGVREEMKPRFASLNFVGQATTWLQTIQLRGRLKTWSALHTAVCAHFDKDQYPLHMKQLDNLKQTGSVAEYYTKFEQLAHSILLYNPAYDDVFFVTRFLNGLKEEIQAPIILHRPKDLEAASTLALLQEAELDSAKSKSHSKADQREQTKFSYMSLSNIVKQHSAPRAEQPHKERTNVDSSWENLKAHRKANGLCFTCGEKWTGRNHRCPTQVPLHVIKEFMEVLQLSANSDDDDEPEPELVEETVMAVSNAPGGSIANTSCARRQTIRFKGVIGKQ